MTNLNAVAKALMNAAEEMKTCKRNKSGSVNGNARYAVYKRAVAALIEAGETESDASAMAWETIGRR